MRKFQRGSRSGPNHRQTKRDGTAQRGAACKQQRRHIKKDDKEEEKEEEEEEKEAEKGEEEKEEESNKASKFDIRG